MAPYKVNFESFDIRKYSKIMTFINLIVSFVVIVLHPFLMKFLYWCDNSPGFFPYDDISILVTILMTILKLISHIAVIIEITIFSRNELFLIIRQMKIMYFTLRKMDLSIEFHIEEVYILSRNFIILSISLYILIYKEYFDQFLYTFKIFSVTICIPIYMIPIFGGMCFVFMCHIIILLLKKYLQLLNSILIKIRTEIKSKKTLNKNCYYVIYSAMIIHSDICNIAIRVQNAFSISILLYLVSIICIIVNQIYFVYERREFLNCFQIHEFIIAFYYILWWFIQGFGITQYIRELGNIQCCVSLFMIKFC